MSIAWGILTLALIGGELDLIAGDVPKKPAKPAIFTIRLVRDGGDRPVPRRLTTNLGIAQVEPEQISYEVRVIDTPASEWREAFYRHCKRIGREGRSTIWTLDEKTAAEMAKRQQGSPRTRVVAAPKITSFAGASATVTMKDRRSFVVDVDRVADGPVDHAPALAFRPSVEEVEEGMTVHVAGKRTADGVRAHVKLDSTWVGHVAQATTSETVENKEHGKSSLSTSLQLPQVVEAKVEGDYEIPSGRQMVVSLGTSMTVDDRGRPVVMERLLTLAARPILIEAEEARAARAPVDGRVRPAAAPDLPNNNINQDVGPERQEPFIANKAYRDIMASVGEALRPRKMPPLPSRTPMQPIGPDGKVVELPPLPDEFVAEAEALDASGPPKPSPQAVVPRRASRIDPQIAPARLAVDPAPVGHSTLHLDGRELASGRTQLVRIPLGVGLAIEVKARLVPAETQPE